MARLWSSGPLPPAISAPLDHYGPERQALSSLFSTAGLFEAKAHQLPTADLGRHKTRNGRVLHSMERELSCT
jgi:hypothetical protein